MGLSKEGPMDPVTLASIFNRPLKSLVSFLCFLLLNFKFLAAPQVLSQCSFRLLQLLSQLRVFCNRLLELLLSFLCILLLVFNRLLK